MERRRRAVLGPEEEEARLDWPRALLFGVAVVVNACTILWCVAGGV